MEAAADADRFTCQRPAWRHRDVAFHGAGVFWRAEQAPDCGKADVFLDGVLQKTVDCCGGYTPYKFWFVRTGLDPKAVHTIKVVVRGDKNAKATGARIKHLGFEYATETSVASHAFSGIMGRMTGSTSPGMERTTAS